MNEHTGIGTGMTEVAQVVKRVWGFDSLRPLQEQAIRAGLERRDSLVVMPTGGGKSLCYQVPPLVVNRIDLVVSPLISLMKDQVDGLRELGYPAAALHSNLSRAELADIEQQAAAGKYRLLFVAPERLTSSSFSGLLGRLSIGAFAIDEAHCISHWGHDFRPEYRQLAVLKQRYPQCGIHAYTATATDRVRSDIVAQLRLKDPAVLVGCFDRPNLTYRVVPRVHASEQVRQVIDRHRGRAVIVYCITRRETEDLAFYLRSHGVRADHYHAGMEADERRRTQDDFASEKLDVVVATVAFGMGIDRSDVRCVIHAAMPKSVEHYQQETGRAGRDGLPAECVLFYSAGDVMRWESVMRKSGAENERSPEVMAATLELLGHMQRFCSMPECRHRGLSQYFGQAYASATCGACDVCLNEAEGVADATVTAQKILSCVARVGERFGIGHVVDVLLGSNTEAIRSREHHQLSTFALLKEMDKKALTNLVYQLVDQKLVERTTDEYPILRLNEDSWRVLRGERTVRLLQPTTRKLKKTRGEVESWAGVDEGLFESLRALRREIAEQRAVPAFVIFGDATLRDMARLRPGTIDSLGNVYGLGEKKLADLGSRFVEHIRGYCAAHQLSLDVQTASMDLARRAPHATASDAKGRAFELFSQGGTIENVMTAIQRARSTTVSYLAEFIETRLPQRIDAWVDDSTFQQVAAAAEKLGADRLRPIFDHLEEQVPYDTIRLVVTHLNAHGRAIV